MAYTEPKGFFYDQKMAKDPAFLFYHQDFFTGVSDMTNDEVGAYIRCLCIQASKGGISEKHMKLICNSHDVHSAIKNKFIFDPATNLFLNERLKSEIEKRKKYSESRSNNRKNPNKKDEDMSNISISYVKHMENENENEVVIEKEKKPRFSKPTLAEVQAFMSEVNMVAGGKWDQTKIQATAKAFFNYYESNGWHVGRSPMKNWQAAVRNWMNREHTQTNKQINGKNNSSREPLDAATIAAKHFGIPIPTNPEPSQDPQGQSNGGGFSDYQVID